MKKLRVIYYLFKQGVTNIARNIFMVFASVVVVFAVLTIVGSIFLLSQNVQSIMEQFSDRAEVQINFSYYVTEEEATVIMDAIKEDSRVENITFVSKEENLNNILSYFEDEKELFESYKDSERLKYVSLEIELAEFVDGEAFVKEAEGITGVDNVKDIVSTIKKMEIVRFWLRIGTVIALVIMLVLSILLIFNTVKLTVFARKREIQIMKYIGATDTYISAPFIFEGVITGILGAIVAFFAVGALYNSVLSSVTNSGILGNIAMLSFKGAGSTFIFFAFLLFGIISGFIASAWAVRRYVNV